ncbi:MAG TPA: DUF507 family protein [Thermoanaerobaculia bacterium]|nr:DUF507 family protein [Thermoanaerobaculia bacterium]
MKAAAKKELTKSRSTKATAEAPEAVESTAMVRPSRERLSHLARELVDALARSRAVVLLKDREVVRQAVAQALAEELRREEDCQENARRRISTMRGAPRPKTREYEELFRQLMEEEYLREGLDS